MTARVQALSAVATPRVGVAALRHRTQPWHQRLERSVVARTLLAPTLQRAVYGQMLRRWVLAWRPLQAALDAADLPADLAAWRPPSREAAAAADLAWLGLPPLPEALSAPARPAHCATDALVVLGLLHVMRGSALGAKVIGAQLAVSLDLPEGQGLQFWDASGEGGWPAWLRLADSRLQSPAALEAAVLGAQWAYAQLLLSFAAPLELPGGRA